MTSILKLSIDFSFMVNQEILVIAFGIFGFAKNTPDTPLSSVPDCWETQVKIEVYQYFYISA